MPTVPHSRWRRATWRHLCALKWGRSPAARPSKNAAIAARLPASPSTSTRRAGVTRSPTRTAHLRARSRQRVHRVDRRPMPRGADDDGFSLIEFMVVVLVIGVLLASAIVARTRAEDRATMAL